MGRSPEYTQHGRRVRLRTITDLQAVIERRGLPLPDNGEVGCSHELFSGRVSELNYFGGGRFVRIRPEGLVEGEQA